jgi:transcriptional regulator with XRE-family HTH domain
VTRTKQIDAKSLFGSAVRKFRHEKKISQEKLAELAEIHRTYIGDVERGIRNISLANMVKIASALGVPLSRLIAEMEANK